MTLISYYVLLTKSCVVLIALAVSFGYLNVRLKMKSQEFRPNFKNELWPLYYGGPRDKIESCQSLGPILISYDTKKNSEQNAELFMRSPIFFNTYFNSSYFCTSESKFINICNEEQDCDTVDLRVFLREYFVEVTSRPIFSKQIHEDIDKINYVSDNNSDTEPYYFLKRDLEWMPRPNFVDYAHRNQFEILGFMLGIAAVTGTFIDIKFAPFFHCSFSESYDIFNLLDYLDLVDPDQYFIYKDIRRNEFYNQKIFIFKSDSLKPFGYVEKESFGSNNLSSFSSSSSYAAFNYPFCKAKNELFIKPYVKSRTLIDIGLGHVFNNNYTDYTYYTYFNSKCVGSDSIDMEIFWGKSLANIEKLFYSWKDFSHFDNSTRIFWKAFFKFNREEKLKIYQKVTGLVNIPFGGFKRLPRTKIIISELGMFSRKFEIHLKENSTVSSIVKEIIFDLF